MIEFRRIDFKKHKDLCVELREDSFRASFPESWREHWDVKGYNDWIEGYAQQNPDGVLHVWHRDKIIGQLEFSYSADNGHVNLYYLVPSFRRKGYGAICHEHVANTMRRNGCKTATLRVSPENPRAIAFYKKLGWVDLGLDQERGNVHTFTINL